MALIELVLKSVEENNKDSFILTKAVRLAFAFRLESVSVKIRNQYPNAKKRAKFQSNWTKEEELEF